MAEKKKKPLTLEEELKEVEDDIKSKQKRAKELKKEISKKEEAARTHRKIVVGAKVLSKINFNSVTEEFDCDKWDNYLDTYRFNIRRECIRLKPKEKPEEQSQEESQESASEQKPADQSQEESQKPTSEQPVTEDKDFY